MSEDEARRVRRRLEALLGTPASDGNSVTVYRNGDEIFPAMLDAIVKAERSVDLMTYVYWSGSIAHQFADALSGRAEAGVRVRLLIDAIGGSKIEDGLVDKMQDSGVDVQWFRKPFRKSPFKQNHRCHRKVLVVDEVTAFTGGVGIAEEWTGDARGPREWRDTHVMVEGPAVDGVAAGFSQNWAETGQPMYDDRDLFPEHDAAGPAVVQAVRGSASIGWDDMQTLFHVAIGSATQRLRIATAYFAPSQDFVDLLLDRANNGVQVQILVPGPGADKRVCQLASESIYAELVDGGIEVWNFQPSMLHAKILTLDGVLSVVGSSNFNRRSMNHDEEIALAIVNADVTATLDAHFDDDLARSSPIDLERWRNRSGVQKVMEQAVQPVRRWL